MNRRDPENVNRKPERKRSGLVWLCLIPILAAFIVCYLRFPLLHNDDHVPVIRHIARTGDWPGVLTYRSAMHSLLYHTAAAGIYRLLDWSTPLVGIPPDRSGQLLNLVAMTGIAVTLIFILRELIEKPGPRIFALLTFGACTRWITAAVTIDKIGRAHV